MVVVVCNQSCCGMQINEPVVVVVVVCTFRISSLKLSTPLYDIFQERGQVKQMEIIRLWHLDSFLAVVCNPIRVCPSHGRSVNNHGSQHHSLTASRGGGGAPLLFPSLVL